MASYWGVDVSTRALDAVAIDAAGRVTDQLVVAPSRMDDLVAAIAATAAVVAVDAPSGWSENLHLADVDLPPKFRPARCGEVALRAQHGYAVPWPTPAGPGERTGWMEVGITLHDRLARSVRTVEVFPHAVFLQLAGVRSLPRKSSPAGAQLRATLLADRLEVAAGPLSRWTVDARDALAAALTARDVADGTSEPAICRDHPASGAIHLPAGAAAAPPPRA